MRKCHAHAHKKAEAPTHAQGHLHKQYRKKTKEKEAHICVQLSDKAGEVVVLEELRKQILGKIGDVPNNKAVVVIAPRHDLICCRIVDHLIGLGEKWRGHIGVVGAISTHVQII